MSVDPLVVLFGDSLILDSVEAGLAGDQGFSVLRLRSAHPEIAERLRAISPAMIIFDLNAPCFHSIVPFLRSHAGVPLLGVDINGNIAVSLACTHYLAQSQGDLQAIIRSHIHSDAGPTPLSLPTGEAVLLSQPAPHGGD
ncbi:MAG: hypothetical protein JXC32_18915 [Anaerolineae bacterium]|nr:hypothetical protein [Anaerolineae bacterium]